MLLVLAFESPPVHHLAEFAPAPCTLAEHRIELALALLAPDGVVPPSHAWATCAPGVHPFDDVRPTLTRVGYVAASSPGHRQSASHPHTRGLRPPA